MATAFAPAALRHRGLGRIFRPREPEEDWETFNWLHADSILDSEPPKHTRLRRPDVCRGNAVAHVKMARRNRLGL